MATPAVDGKAATERKSSWRESSRQIIVAVLVALLIRAFIFEAFKIPSGSMIPTLHIGDQIFVNKFVYGPRIPFTEIRVWQWGQPARGEIIVFVHPKGEHEDLIKRVVGLPGDTVEVRAGVVLLNNEPLKSETIGQVTEWDLQHGGWAPEHATAMTEHLGDTSFTVLDDGFSMGDNLGPFTVEPGHLFVMGDNRDRSSDSRFWGQVPMQNVLGRAMFIWWSWGKDGLDYKRIGTWLK